MAALRRLRSRPAAVRATLRRREAPLLRGPYPPCWRWAVAAVAAGGRTRPAGVAGSRPAAVRNTALLLRRLTLLRRGREAGALGARAVAGLRVLLWRAVTRLRRAVPGRRWAVPTGGRRREAGGRRAVTPAGGGGKPVAGVGSLGPAAGRVAPTLLTRGCGLLVRRGLGHGILQGLVSGWSRRSCLTAEGAGDVFRWCVIGENCGSDTRADLQRCRETATAGVEDAGGQAPPAECGTEPGRAGAGLSRRRRAAARRAGRWLQRSAEIVHSDLVQQEAAPLQDGGESGPWRRVRTSSSCTVAGPAASICSSSHPAAAAAAA